MINVLILDLNAPGGSHEPSYFESNGRQICYKNFLMKETIKLVSLFDEDAPGLSSDVKPHVIICPHKGSPAFQLLYATSYTSASLLATLMKFDTSANQIQNKQSDCNLTVLDYVAQGKYVMN